MAEAGFYLAREPDEVRCYYCRRELDGWEPEDIPWKEHERRDCPFIKKGKTYKQLSVEDAFELEAERYIAILEKLHDNELELLSRRAEEIKEQIKELGIQKQTKGGKSKKKKY